VQSNFRKSQSLKESNVLKALSFNNQQNNFNPMKLIKHNLCKYNMNQTEYSKKIITDLIYDEKKHIVAVFKENLIWDDMADFLHR
jgi:hypothetical protein